MLKSEKNEERTTNYLLSPVYFQVIVIQILENRYLVLVREMGGIEFAPNQSRFLQNRGRPVIVNNLFFLLKWVGINSSCGNI